MKAAQYLYLWRGNRIRVVVAGDVIALPEERWSFGNFGLFADYEWLLHEARLPGPHVRRRVLADVCARSLAAFHGRPAPSELEHGAVLYSEGS